MLNIKVLGPGCANCERVQELAQRAVKTLGVEATVTKITERARWQQYRLLSTPGLVVNEKLVCGGRVPSQAEVTTWLVNALATEE